MASCKGALPPYSPDKMLLMYRLKNSDIWREKAAVREMVT